MSNNFVTAMAAASAMMMTVLSAFGVTQARNSAEGYGYAGGTCAGLTATLYFLQQLFCNQQQPVVVAVTPATGVALFPATTAAPPSQREQDELLQRATTAIPISQ